MRSSSSRLRVLMPGALAVLALGVAACGSSSSSSSSGSGGAPPAAVSKEVSKYQPLTSPPSNAKTGGTLTVIGNSDVDYIDPGAAYYQPTYMVDQAVLSTLMGYPPSDTSTPEPLLASGQPQLSNGGKTITFHIKSGIKYSPPLGGGAGWTKPVVAADVKYALQRTLLPGVPNGYASLYLADIQGFSAAMAAVKKNPTVAPDISGIQTPNDTTIVITLTKPSALGVIGALSLPASAPIPQGYAAKFDSQKPTSTYGEHQIDTGPYYIASYKPGTQITVLRNPNYTKGQDFRPAYLDKIVVQEGFSDENSAVQKILTGQSQVNFDFDATGEALKLAATKYPHQLTLTPAGSNRFVALNTSKPPFNNINVRKAVIAASNREELLATRGGALSGATANHFIPPGMPGFQQAGGYNAPSGLDFLSHPTGDMSLATSYMKKAGGQFASGKCDSSKGSCTITMVSDDSPPGSNTAQVVKSQLATLGFTVQLHPVAHDVMYTKFCNVVANEPSVCPNVGWVKDFNDGQAVIDVPFNGATITGSPSNSSNWAQLNDPQVNNALNQAKLITSSSQRATAYGNIDKMVMALAPVIMWDWDYETNVSSSNVIPVISQENGLTDLSTTSLK